MTTNWKGGNGNWQTAAKWTAGAPTTPAAFAVINAAGTYTVTIGTGLEYHVGAVWLNAAGATLAIKGTLDLTNKFTVSKGTLALSGTLAGGTLLAAGGTIDLQSATLDGISYGGTLDLAKKATTITVKDGLTLTGAAGTGLGTLNLGGTSQINFTGDQVLGHGTFNIAGGTINTIGGTLTFGGQLRAMYTSTANVFAKPSAIANLGTFALGKGAVASIGHVVNGGKLAVNGASLTVGDFMNASGGTITVAAGSTFEAGTTGDFDNDGTLTANKATVTLHTDGDDFGTLNIANSTVSIDGITDTAGIATVTGALTAKSNSVTLGLMVDNTGNTLDLTAPAGFTKFAYSGSIDGGTVTIDPSFSGALSKLTVEGPLAVTGDLVIDNVTFTGAGGTGQGLVTLNGDMLVGNHEPTASLDNVKIVASANSAMNPGVAKTTIGADSTIQALSAFEIGGSQAFRVFINNGTLEADGPAGTAFYLNANRITNNGTIKVENGGTFKIGAHVGFLNLYYTGVGQATKIALTGGTYIVGAHSNLFYRNTTVSANSLQATVTLEGAGANFLTAGVLTMIGAQGALTLENGATLSFGNNLTIAGILSLAGSNFTEANTTITAAGELAGNGAVLGAVANSGLIDAAGGTLSIGQDVTGTGQTKIEGAATLQFGSDVSAGQTVEFVGSGGTLALGNAGGFDGTISGFAPGAAIDLINTKAGSVVYSAVNHTLSVKFQGTVIATLNIAGDYTGDTFGVASDGHGGTDITVGVTPAALHRFTEARAAFAPTSMASVGSQAIAGNSHLASPLAASALH